MQSERTPRFWELARAVAGEARRHGLVVPGFRSPPRLPGAVRTVRRSPGGGMVAVAWRGRTAAAVMADMLDGVVQVNGLCGPEAAACRRILWEGLAAGTALPALAGAPTADGPQPVVHVLRLVQRPGADDPAAATG